MSEHEKIGYEKSDVKVLPLFLWCFIPGIVIVLAVVALNSIYQANQIKREIKVGAADTSEYRQIWKKDSTQLKSYGNAADGDQYTLPIERAKYLMLQRKARQGN